MKIGKLYLKVPDKSDLWYRIKLLSDPDTMGCIQITQDQAEKWLENWTNVFMPILYGQTTILSSGMRMSISMPQAICT